MKTPVIAAVCLLLPATAAAQKGAFVEALVAFDAALEGTYGDEGPKLQSALDSMAGALETWDAESRAAAAALRATGDAATLARFFVSDARPIEALDAVDTALREAPGRASLHQLRGMLLAAAGRDEDALAAFEAGWRLDPRDGVTAYLLASRMSARRADAADPPLAAMLDALKRPAGASPHMAFIHAGLIDDSSSLVPRFTRAAYADGVAALGRGRYAEAMDLFRAAIAADPLVVDRAVRSGRAAAGVAALREGRFAAAVADLQAAVAAAPSSAEAHRVLGVAHAAAGHVDAGLKRLSDAIRLAPHDGRARIARGRVLIEAGRFDEAERALLDTLDRLPASGRARWALADLYELTGRRAEALEQLEQAAALPMIAGKTALLWRLATLAHQVLDEERFVAALAQRTRLMPNDPLAHRSLGLAYHRAGRDAEALIELLAASSLGHEDALAFAVMGRIHLNAGRLPMAEAVLRRAVAMAPDSIDARYALARTLLRAGNTREGQAQLAEFERLQEVALAEQRRTFEDESRQRTERQRRPERK